MRASTPASGRSIRLINFAETLLIDLRRQALGQRHRQIGMLLRRRAQLAIQIALRQHVRRAAGRIGAQQKRVQHHVVPEALRFHAVFRQRQRQRLHVVRDL